MRHSIIFRSIAVLLFLTFVATFVSYHAGVIRAEDLLFFEDDSVKRKAGKFTADTGKVRLTRAQLDSLSRLSPPGYQSETSKSGAIIRRRADRGDTSVFIQSPIPEYNGLSSKSGRIIQAWGSDEVIDGRLLSDSERARLLRSPADSGHRR
jgi:hypothetical protein